MQRALDTPWKVANRVQSWLDYPIVRLLFLFNGIPWGKGWSFYGIPIVQKHRHSAVRFGAGLSLRSSVRSNALGPNHPVILCTCRADARLETGSRFGMTGGTICAAESVRIGNDVLIGANSIVTDFDFHPLDPVERHLYPNDGASAPVVIEDDVFVGMHCLILKGVTIGTGSVVGAGSVVTRDVPAHCVVAGNPAQVVRQATDSRR